MVMVYFFTNLYTFANLMCIGHGHGSFSLLKVMLSFGHACLFCHCLFLVLVKVVFSSNGHDFFKSWSGHGLASISFC